MSPAQREQTLQIGTRVALPRVVEHGIETCPAETGTVLGNSDRDTLLVQIDFRHWGDEEEDGLREVPRRSVRVLKNVKISREEANRLKAGCVAALGTQAPWFADPQFWMLDCGVLGVTMGGPDQWDTLLVWAKDTWVMANAKVVA